MEEKQVPLIPVTALAQAAFNLKSGLDNRIDFYTCLDTVDKTVSECFAISKIDFNDTTVFLVGGYGGYVNCVSMPPHIYDEQEEIEVMDEIAASIAAFICSDNQTVVGVDDESAHIDWANVPADIKDSLNNSEKYTVE